MESPQACPCGSGRAYTCCCGRFLDGGEAAATAELLMRSRYTAFVLVREDYLLRTWHDSTRPAELALKSGPSATWLGLQVIRSEAGGQQDHNAVVEFVARYKVQGKAMRVHETSRFVRENGEWFYVSGDVEP